VHDAGADPYGLPPEEGPDFAPPDAVPADEMPEEWES
jgi:hypothetical protein